MTYAVVITPAAKLRIRQQAEHIAVEQGAPGIAARWLARVFDKIDGLAEMPRRYAAASVEDWCDYEVRHVPIGQFVLFFTVVDETQTVWVIHAKHGKQLTHRDAFPRDLESLESDEE